MENFAHALYLTVFDVEYLQDSPKPQYSTGNHGMAIKFLHKVSRVTIVRSCDCHVTLCKCMYLQECLPIFRPVLSHRLVLE